MPNEADTCRRYVLPKLYAAGWTDDQISEQKTFTDGKIVVAGNKATRQKPKRADYILTYTRDLMIAVVEAKATYKGRGTGSSRLWTMPKFWGSSLPTPPTGKVSLNTTF